MLGQATDDRGWRGAGGPPSSQAGRHSSLVLALPQYSAGDQMEQDWGYGHDNGPATWAERYPLAAGARQSPVDIDTSLASPDSALVHRPLQWSYEKNIAKRIINTGYGWKVDLDGEHTELTGGPLQGKYRLEQFHCHWGKTSEEGSEHTVDGKAYAAELHFVHWNCDKYSTFSEAASQPDGLAVLGVFIKVGKKKHEELAKIVELIPNIIHKGQSMKIDCSIKIKRFLPQTPRYWTYLGSLTTPPCSESVIWIVFKEPIKVKEKQLCVFRRMKTVSENVNMDSDECTLTCNYRPPLPLGNRVLRECGSL